MKDSWVGIQFRLPPSKEKRNNLTLARNPDIGNIEFCRGDRRLQMKEYLIQSYYTYFLFSCEIRGILLKNLYYWKLLLIKIILSKKVFGLDS
jgi:hypothetical protein